MENQQSGWLNAQGIHTPSQTDSAQSVIPQGPALRGRGSGRSRRPSGARGGTFPHRGRGFGNKSAVFSKPSTTVPSHVESTPSNDEENYPQESTDLLDSEGSTIPGSVQTQPIEITWQIPVENGRNQPSLSSSVPEKQLLLSFASNVDQDKTFNALGGKRQDGEERKKRFEDLPKQNRFFEMRTQRDALRSKYIDEGLLPDPDKPLDLSAAKTFKGTCMQMCPEFEREEREFQNEGDILEMVSQKAQSLIITLFNVHFFYSSRDRIGLIQC